MSRRRIGASAAPLRAHDQAAQALTRSQTLTDAPASARSRRLCYAACATGLVVALVTATIICNPAPRLVWNASASAPLGLYRVSPGGAPDRGGLVIAWIPPRWRSFSAARRYLPVTVPLVKRVAAEPSQTVCAQGNAVFIEGKHVADRLGMDARGRAMPWWNGCRKLAAREYFLLMVDSPQSFDGRYFGISTAQDIIGPARLIWARPDWWPSWRFPW